MTIEAEEKNEIKQLMKQHADTGLKLELLFFWNKYPYAKFTSGIIARALGSTRRVEVEEALEAFAEAELIEKHVQRGLPFYCLATAPEKREPILRLLGGNGNGGGYLKRPTHARKQLIRQFMFEES